MYIVGTMLKQPTRSKDLRHHEEGGKRAIVLATLIHLFRYSSVGACFDIYETEH